MKINASIASSFGNIIEWYDFILFGYLAAKIAGVFFPSSNHMLSLMGAFAGFAVGFITRPLGALFFSHIGDKYGKAKVLRFLIVAMNIPTLLIGIMPGFAQIGMLAPVLIIMCRLIQGFFVGPQYSGSIVYTLEQASANTRGVKVALNFAGISVGIIVGAFISYLSLRIFKGYEWAWRVPFLLTGILLVLSLLIRNQLVEAPQSEPSVSTIAPLKHVLANHKRQLMIAVCIITFFMVSSYLVSVFNATFLHKFVGIPLSTSILVTTVSEGFRLFVAVGFGFLYDRFGLKRAISLLWVIAAASVPYAYHILLQGHLFWIYVMQFYLMIFVSAISVYSSIAVCQLFPSSVRYTGFAISNSLTAMVMGGTVPFYATTLIYWFGTPIAASYLFIFATILSLVGWVLFYRVKHYAIARNES